MKSLSSAESRNVKTRSISASSKGSKIVRPSNRLIHLATDDLRKEAGKFFVYQCQMEREKQLMDKKRDVERKIMEEQVYAQLWKLDLMSKEERERQEAEEKKKRIGETVAVLDWQKDTRVQVKQ